MVGAFVYHRDKRALGIGKIESIDVARACAKVEFFDSPTSAQRPTFEWPLKELNRVPRLENQTRVYFFDGALGAWRMGRVATHVDNWCFVALPNNQQAKLEQSTLFVRWNRPIADPIEHLQVGLTETPFFFTRRTRLFEHLVRQRAVSAGLTALLSAPVFLEPHQIEVVSRVLSDPIQRYLLADEVGLGKTIEAGIIARQHILDNPDTHRVLVVVPRALVVQWHYELADRCKVGSIFGHRLSVVSFEEFEAKTDWSADLLIVDEAHQIARRWKETGRGIFARLCDVSHPDHCAKLLLLSATPVRGNEDGFLGLLHLLDPMVYRLDAVDEFRMRVARRQALADLFATLTEDQPDYFLAGSIAALAEMFPKDQRLQGLVVQLKPLVADNGAPDATMMDARRRGVSALRTHLAESYRLHRRLLRNRRTAELESLLPGRAGLEVRECETRTFADIEGLLDVWRSRAAAALWGRADAQSAAFRNTVALFLAFLETAWQSDAAFFDLIKSRKASLQKAQTSRSRSGLPAAVDAPTFDGEADLLNEILAEQSAFEEEHDAHLDVVCEIAAAKSTQFERVVVICSHPAVADRVFRRLNIRTTARTVRCSPEAGPHEGWLEAQILVCDATAEEGLNLQGGSACLVHADLPLSPNRLEQRLGRLDRIGVGKAVPSICVVPAATPYYGAWADLLNTVWGVFTRSIASLQYLVDDEMTGLRSSLFTDGSGAFVASKEKLGSPKGVIESELRSIQNQDALDSIGRTEEGRVGIADQIEEYERGCVGFTNTLDQWLGEGLRFVRVGETSPGDRVFRYHYRSGSSGQQTLLARPDFLFWFERSIDPSANHPAFTQPLSWPMTAARETARIKKVSPARLGSPLIDSVERHLRWEDRGTCCAFWRKDPAKPKAPKAYFRFSAIVEADRAALETWSASEQQANVNAVVRIADSQFEPLYAEVWLDQEMLGPDESARVLLRAEYDKANGDRNISSLDWAEVFKALDLTAHQWAEVCRAVRQQGERAVMETYQVGSRVAETLVRFDRAHEQACDQMTSRLAALPDAKSEHRFLMQEINRLQRLHDAVQASIRAARVRFDAVCVVILIPS